MKENITSYFGGHGYSVECTYRLKSKRSLIHKIIKYINNDEKHIPSSSDEYDFDISPIVDVFAMNFILTGRSESFYYKDPEIERLISEEEDNKVFASEMKRFATRLINTDNPSKPQFLYEVTKKEYYERCIQILDRLISILPPEATAVIERYTKQKKSFRELLNFIEETMPEEDILVDETDYPTEGHNIDFIRLLDSLYSKIHDKLDLAVLTIQVNSLFSNSKLLEGLGVKLVGFEEKRTERGYVANFVHLSTPYGNIEFQLQSKNQYKDGNTGDSAHSELEDKDITGFKIPNVDNPKETKKFARSVSFVSPNFGIAMIDRLKGSSVILQELGDFMNYVRVLRQVREGEKLNAVDAYIAKLKSISHRIFKSFGISIEISRNDILKYIREHSFNDKKDLEGPSL